MLSDRCLPCLSVKLVYCLQTVGWITKCHLAWRQALAQATRFVFFGKKSMQHLSEKTQFLGFLFPK